MSLSPKEKLEEDEQWIDDYVLISSEGEGGELSEAEKKALADLKRHEEMRTSLQADFEEAIEQGSFDRLVRSIDIYVTNRILMFYSGLIYRGQIPPYDRNKEDRSRSLVVENP